MADPSPSPSVWSLLARMGPYLRKDLTFYVLALLAAPVSTLLVVAQPWLLKRAIDEHIRVGDVNGLAELAAGYLVLVVAAFVAEAAYTLALSYGAMRTIRRLRAHVYAHTLSLAQSYYDREPTGRLLTRATSDVEALGETLTAGAITIVLDVLLVLGILGAMFSLDAKLTGILLLASPVLAIAINAIRSVMRRLFLTVRTAASELNAYLAERITGLTVVQLYSDEARTQAEFDVRLQRYRNATIKSNFWDALLFAIVDGVSSICMALLLWYATGDLWGGTLVTAGLLAAFIEYIGRLFQPIRDFSQKLAVIQRAAAALEKIFGLLDTTEQLAFGDHELTRPVQSLVVEDLRFAYGDGPRVLDGVSFRLDAGRTVAIVGRTGSGKSTIGKLLSRAYQGYQGSIRLDGVELTELNRSSIAANVGVVQQDTQLFAGTVRFNLSLGHDIPDAELLEAVALCGAEPLLRRLGGLDGRISHRGGNVSVGEAQLLSFARTLARQTPVVLLDEATASVDSLTEAALQQATTVLLERRTVVVIAHRLSTIMNADEILVLDAGKVLERGTHPVLMAANGVYAALFHAAEESTRDAPPSPR